MTHALRVLLVGVSRSRLAPFLDALARQAARLECVESDPGDAAASGTGWDLIIAPRDDLAVVPHGAPVRLAAQHLDGGEHLSLEGAEATVTGGAAGQVDALVSHVMRALRAVRVEAEIERLRSDADKRARSQEVLAELGVRALSAIDLNELIEHGLGILTRTLGVECAAVLEPVPGSDLLLMRAGVGWRADVGRLLLNPGPESLVGYVMNHGGPIVTEWTDRSVTPTGMPFLRDHNVRCGISVALAGPDGPRGVLGVYSALARPFTREDVLFVQGVANVVAAAISRKATEEGLLQSQVRLQSVQKMEAIGRLAGGIAHDFNNLVQAIAGYTEILLQRLPEQDGLRHPALQIKREGDRAAALTRQLLAFSRQQVLQPRVLDLNAVVTNVEQLLRRLIGEDVELETELAAGIGPVRADAAQLEQVLMNLAVNARDAMPEGGTLTIETRNVALSAADQREVFAIQPGPYVMLAVTDTGVGMDAETRSRAFEPFFTTKAPGQGTGLGLSTVYGIVKQSDGYIWVDSEPGQGTRVRLYLPRVDAPVEVVEPRRPAGAAAMPRGAETVLLVEDEPGVRDLITEWLSGHGYRVMAAPNGAEALALAEAHAGAIDLLIADVIMPQMGGPALAARLVPLRPEMKVIYVSGYADEAIGDPDVLAAGAAFLQKPFSLDALVRKVREILDARAAVT